MKSLTKVKALEVQHVRCIPYFRELEHWVVVIELKETITIKHSMVMNGSTIDERTAVVVVVKETLAGHPIGELSHAVNELRSHNRGDIELLLLLLLLMAIIR